MLPTLLLLCGRAQTEICQSIFHDLHQAGNISEQTMEQLYSEAAGKFLADRFVYGTCPKCGYEVGIAWFHGQTAERGNTIVV